MLSITRAALLALSILVVGAYSANAVPQFVPNATQQLHTFGSGQPGAEFDTQGTGVGGNIDYNSGTGRLTITGVLDVLNYFDAGPPADAGCPTNVGSNCAFNFGPGLDITLEADYQDLVVTPIAGTIVQVAVNFVTTGGTDLTVTDPTDGGSTQLTADIVAGVFSGTPVVGITATVIYDTGTGTALALPSGTAFLETTGGPLASLLEPDGFGIAFASFDDFVNGGGSGGGLNELIGDSILAGDLQSFTAESEGQVFRTATGEFVPEPAGLIGLGAASLLIGLFGRRGKRS